LISAEVIKIALFRRAVTWTDWSKTVMLRASQNAPVAHLDRVLVSEAKGSGFDSRRAHQQFKGLEKSGSFIQGWQQPRFSPRTSRFSGGLFRRR
jgi:hypothetical protein